MGEKSTEQINPQQRDQMYIIDKEKHVHIPLW